MALYIIIALMALVIGGLAAVLIMFLIANSGNKKQGKQTAVNKLKSPRKLEFSKIVLTFVLLTYFVGVFIGVKVSLIDFSQLGVLLAYIGTPTAAAIGFYCWKAKAENIVKIKKDNPEETEGISVDLNNINNI
ncbi:MAG: hypothetical protein HDT43_00680 [Ruminococcaceae bacterium]|nr:hypothetical protein [Oscillospiraceae bacterium]